MSDILVKDYNINPNLDSLQEGKEGVFIYPSETFCVDLPINYACHHFHGSWLTENDNKTHWKLIVKKDYFKNKYFQMLDSCDKGHQALEKSGMLKWYSTQELMDEIKERLNE